MKPPSLAISLAYTVYWFIIIKLIVVYCILIYNNKANCCIHKIVCQEEQLLL